MRTHMSEISVKLQVTHAPAASIVGAFHSRSQELSSSYLIYRHSPAKTPPERRRLRCVDGGLNPTALRLWSMMGPSTMAARAAGCCSSAALAFFRLHPLRCAVRPAAALVGGCSSGLRGGCRSRLAHSIVDLVMEELRSRRRVRVSAK